MKRLVRLATPALAALTSVMTRAAVRKRQLLRATERYLAELREEVGEPSAQDKVRTAAVVERIRRRQPDSTAV